VEVPLPSRKSNYWFPDDVKANKGSFQLEKLPYPYDALAYSFLLTLECIIPNTILPTLTILIMPLPELNMKINPSKIFYQKLDLNNVT
jgi:Fe-Mn family superoxide dismutase